METASREGPLTKEVKNEKQERERERTEYILFGEVYLFYKFRFRPLQRGGQSGRIDIKQLQKIISKKRNLHQPI